MDFLTAALIRMRREDGMWQRFFAANQLQPLEIWYEDLAADPVGACRTILEYLQLPDVAPPASGSGFRRQSDATSERWVRRYQALEVARFEATYSAMASVDPGADFLIAESGLERPDAWDESRHSLLATDGYTGPLTPDYRVTFASEPPARDKPSADVRFVRDRAAATAARDIVLPQSSAGSYDAAVLAAHLGADRVGLPDPAARGGSYDIGQTRVLLLDGSPEGLDVHGFLRLPPRRRGNHSALRIAVLTGPVPAEWMYALRQCLAALTWHHCTFVEQAAQLRPAAIDVVICARDDTVDCPKALRYEAFRGSRLRLRAADHHVDVPHPVAWWSRISRESGAHPRDRSDFTRDWDDLWAPAIAAAMAA
jgi:hypothetical protein